MDKLLTRDEFRETIFKRDNHKCVICREEGADAHHIGERRVWGKEGNFGYLLSNGATLCPLHHIEAEETILSCEEIRKAAGIKEIVLPDHLDPYDTYDKWYNIILSNGMRVPGELFDDPSVQKILHRVRDLFVKTPYRKYPRTPHLIHSPGCTSDDKKLDSHDHFIGKNVVISVKMDGENTTFYQDFMHARSLDSDNHISRAWVKNLHSQIAHDINEKWRICAENLYAVHSINYQELPSYLLVHSIWDDKNMCLSWKDTLEWCELLGLSTVPTFYEGPWDEKKIKALTEKDYKLTNDEVEGYVVRVVDTFHYRDFHKNVAKYVRKNHVRTPHNWKNLPMKVNGIVSPQT